MDLAAYTINNFAGGLSDEAGRGVPGSFRNGFNLNIHKKGSNILSANQKLKKISDEAEDEGDHEVVDLIIKIVPVSVTKSYAFGDAGNVYKIVNETVTKIYTDPDANILDADFFYGYLYWTTTTHLKRHLESTATWNDGNCGALSEDAGTFNECDYHPIFIVPKSDLLTVGNGRYVATVNDTPVFNAEALDLFYGWEVRCLTLEKPNLLIGAKNNKKAEMFTWDLTSESYDPVEGWEERDIDAFLKGIGTTYLFTPTLLYWFNQGLVDRAKELPSQVKPGAIDIWKGKMLLGGTNFIYSYHKKNKNYPLALNARYTPSPITIANIDSKDIEIGAILGRADNLLVGWKDGSTYGIDITDNSNKADAVYESLKFTAGRDFEDKLFRHIKILTKPLPTGSSIKVYYKINGGDWTLASRQDGKDLFEETDETKSIHSIEGQGETYEIKIEIYPNGNNSPEVTSINTYFESLGIK